MNKSLFISVLLIVLFSVSVFAVTSIYYNQRNEIGQIFRLRTGESAVLYSEDMKLSITLLDIYSESNPEEPCDYDCAALINVSMHNKVTGNSKTYTLGLQPQDSSFIVEVLKLSRNKALLVVPNDLHYLTDPLEPDEPEIIIPYERIVEIPR